jgi:DNA (cytosine-5)-methyltransferase 1
MKYATVCSGIEACTVAWKPLGWEAQWFSEIDKFPSAVLAHHYPNTPNLGDMTKIHEHETFKKSVGSVDLICGGTPCQSFSIAGLRKGLDDPRGNLALTYLGLVDKLRPEWVIWENVPGVLSSDGGRDFGTFLAALGQIGYGWAYRILDAQYFGVPQRRRRVFVVGHSSGDWRRAAAVLFERKSLSRDNFKMSEKNKNTRFSDTYVASKKTTIGTLMANCGSKKWLGNQEAFSGDYRIIRNGKASYLTPIECERLQGFPDNYTQIPYRNKPTDKCPDGSRYKGLGNSMAVPVMRWIGERIDFVESIINES